MKGKHHYIKFSKTENVHIKGGVGYGSGARELLCNVVRFLDANMKSDTLLMRAGVGTVGRLNRYFLKEVLLFRLLEAAIRKMYPSIIQHVYQN